MPQWSKWRERIGLTQAALAERVGVETSTISHIEIHRRNPSRDLLIKLCRELGLDEAERLQAAGLEREPAERQAA